jgi:hypothetical protein
MALFQLPYLVAEFFVERSFLGTILNFEAQSSTTTSAATLNELGTLLTAELVILAVTLGYYILLLPVAQGAVIRVVSDDYLDRPTGVGPGLSTAFHRIWRLLGYVLLWLGVWTVPALVATGIALLLALAGAGAAAGGLLVVLLIGWFAFSIVASFKLALGIQTVVLERLSPWAALRRSWRLTNGSFWRIVGFYVVIGIVSAIMSGILDGLSGLLVSTAPLATRAGVEVVASGVVAIFTSPFLLILLTLVYYDIRIRREAFDLEMLAQSL